MSVEKEQPNGFDSTAIYALIACRPKMQAQDCGDMSQMAKQAKQV
jgi:hypothetical protein